MVVGYGQAVAGGISRMLLQPNPTGHQQVTKPSSLLLPQALTALIQIQVQPDSVPTKSCTSISLTCDLGEHEGPPIPLCLSLHSGQHAPSLCKDHKFKPETP